MYESYHKYVSLKSGFRFRDLICADLNVVTSSNQKYVSLKSGFGFPDLKCADHNAEPVLTISMFQ